MAFAFTQDGFQSAGSQKYCWGTYTNTSSSTGGDILTGLRVVHEFKMQPTSTAVILTAPVVNETLPLNNSAVTVVTSADETGIWMAIGK